MKGIVTHWLNCAKNQLGWSDRPCNSAMILQQNHGRIVRRITSELWGESHQNCEENHIRIARRITSESRGELHQNCARICALWPPLFPVIITMFYWCLIVSVLLLSVTPYNSSLCTHLDQQWTQPLSFHYSFACGVWGAQNGFGSSFLIWKP